LEIIGKKMVGLQPFSKGKAQENIGRLQKHSGRTINSYSYVQGFENRHLWLQE
jgi:hypothetical protein